MSCHWSTSSSVEPRSCDSYLFIDNLLLFFLPTINTGRCAFTRRLKAPTEQVIWHEETGDYYLLVSHRDIQVRIVFNLYLECVSPVSLKNAEKLERYVFVISVGNRTEVYSDCPSISLLIILPVLYFPPTHSQLFKAADNSIVATLTHGSRINRACFTSVTTSDGADPSSSYRMVTVCDNKTINMFDFSGKQVGFLPVLFLLWMFLAWSFGASACLHTLSYLV